MTRPNLTTPIKEIQTPQGNSKLRSRPPLEQTSLGINFQKGEKTDKKELYWKPHHCWSGGESREVDNTSEMLL